ncbi:sensor histidine kinase [Arcticibacter tournemirensis]|uniref:Sensor histidine kinase n=1 Tax=Arcticibacter tournemirensis TaxID=699437 RepID=A0A4V1KHS4_9SPHI|nr:histidine kinase [Arcticibacter tournemirensis]RXF68202.1 sensor histidine kinase [Arcticibacter tournemirensis]
MTETYNVKTGVIFSFAVAVIASIPKFIRFDALQASNLIESVLNLVICILANWFIHHFFLLKKTDADSGVHPYLRGALSIFVGMCFSVGINYLFRDSNPVSFMNNMVGVKGLTDYQIFSTYLFRSFIISGFCFFVVYYLRLNQNLQRSKIENEQLKQEHLKAALASLKQQISPHFLFNSLSTLRTIAPDSGTKAYVMKLSDVYRYLLNYKENNLAELKDELLFIDSYLYILKERFEEGLQIKKEISDSVFSKHIPPLSLQILIENALKHNIASENRPLYITIYNEDQSFLVVENNLQPKLFVEDSLGQGLLNINDRYRLLAGKEIEVLNNEKRFIVKIPLL